MKVNNRILAVAVQPTDFLHPLGLQLATLTRLLVRASSRTPFGGVLVTVATVVLGVGAHDNCIFI
jgi:hypothetical protein